MKFENTVKLEGTEIEVGHHQPYASLKVFNPENSTQEYNVHPIVRKAIIDGSTTYILAEKPDSAHGVMDEYLTYVLAFYRGQYVTWLCNHSAGGFHYGSYHSGDFPTATQDFMYRGWEHLLPKSTESSEWKKLQKFIGVMKDRCEGTNQDEFSQGMHSAYEAVESKMEDLEEINK
jgi:hypothetical protein